MPSSYSRPRSTQVCTYPGGISARAVYIGLLARVRLLSSEVLILRKNLSYSFLLPSFVVAVDTPPSPILSPPPRQRPSPPPREYEHNAEWNFNPMGIGRNRKDSFGILELPMTATERELRVKYKRLARIYHPDKYKLASNEVSSRMTVLEGQQHFQMISNTYDHLKGT